MAKQYDLMVRILLVGDSGVGKTCLLCRYVDHAFFPSYAATIGIDFKVKHMLIDNQRVRVQIWDTAGQERFETITKQYYRRAQGVLLLYDITNDATYRHIPKWIQNIRQFAQDNVEITLVGNKLDLEEYRKVLREDAYEFARQSGFSFFETSAIVDDDQIELIYEDLVRRILHKQADELKKQRLEWMPSDSDTESEYVTQLLRTDEKKQCCNTQA